LQFASEALQSDFEVVHTALSQTTAASQFVRS
jgi:hypothetical protein